MSSTPAIAAAEPVPPTLYLYLQPGPAAGDAIVRLLQRLPGQADHFLSDGSGPDWQEGTVLRIMTPATPVELAAELAPELSHCAAWTIHDGRQNFIQSPQIYSMARYFDTLRVYGWEPLPFCQLFLALPTADRRAEFLIDAVRARLTRPCIPVFSFGNRRILLLAAPETGETLRRHCAQAIRHLPSWAVIDSRGGVSTATGTGGAPPWGSLPALPRV